jgi:hypothetical protein
MATFALRVLTYVLPFILFFHPYSPQRSMHAGKLLGRTVKVNTVDKPQGTE